MNRVSRLAGIPLLCLSLGVATGAALLAQPVTWEATFGSASGFDDAIGFDLAAGCPGRYAFAGRAQTAAGTHDVYVAVVDENGLTVPGFENIYDVGGLNGPDGGGSIRPTGDGFIVVGTTNMGVVNGPARLHFLKLNCDGTVAWFKTYGDPNSDYVGRDVVVNDDGDYTAAGWRKNRKSGLREAFLVRVSNTGVTRWEHAYKGLHNDNSDNGFYSLTGNTKTPGQVTGDITAVGFTSRPNEGRDAWVVRVDGVTGLFGAPQQGAAFYSSAPNGGDEDFNFVRELQIAPETGRMVYAGHTSFLPNGIDDMYFVKSTLVPWAPLVQVVVGDNGQLWLEFPMGFVEMKMNTPFGQAGDLAVAGVAANRWNNLGLQAYDGFLLKIDKTTLGPSIIWGTNTPGWYYGDHGVGDDGGYAIVYDNSLNPNFVGFSMVGFTKSNLENATPADPNDVYLLKTDPLGKTGCQIEYHPYRQDVPYVVQQDVVSVRDPAQEDWPTIVSQPVSWGIRVCSGSSSTSTAAMSSGMAAACHARR